jgi:hypothetical protein
LALDDNAIIIRVQHDVPLTSHAPAPPRNHRSSPS